MRIIIKNNSAINNTIIKIKCIKYIEDPHIKILQKKQMTTQRYLIRYFMVISLYIF